MENSVQTVHKATQESLMLKDFELVPRVNTVEKALLSAVKNNSLSEVAKLLLQKPDLECADSNGNTAVLLAAYNGATNILSLLKTAGANLFHKNRDGLTAKDIAFFMGYAKFLKEIREIEQQNLQRT